MSIEQMQNEIMAKGFVFQEQTFSNGDVLLHFKKIKEFNPYRDFCLSTTDGWKVGWGRYKRFWAWTQAYEYIITRDKTPKGGW